MLNIVQVQDGILSHLRSEIPQEVYEQGVTDAQTVRKTNGKIVPYVAIQFGSLSPRERGRGFTGVRTFDHDLSMQVQVVAADPTIARKIMYENVYDAMVGLSLPWTGEVYPDRIGGVFPIVTSNGATEAYQYASGFVVTLQMIDV